MLRETYTKKISQKDEVVLQTNHNFFIRATIAAIAKVCLAACLTFAFTFMVSLIVLSLASDAKDANSNTTVLSLISIVFYFALFIYIIVVAVGLLNMYKKSNEIESSIFGDKVVRRSSGTSAKNYEVEDDEEEF